MRLFIKAVVKDPRTHIEHHYAEVKRLATGIPKHAFGDDGLPKGDGPHAHLREPIAAHQYASHLHGIRSSKAKDASDHAWKLSESLKKADRDYSDPQRAFGSSEFERERQEPIGRTPKLPAHMGKAVMGKEKGDFPEKKVAEYAGGKISAHKRESLKREQFALKKKPERGEAKGSYPIHDLSHARNALARVAQHGSEAEQKTVRAAVYKKYPQLKKRKEEREGVEKAMEPTNDAIHILKANRLKTDEGYQAAISALVDAGMRQNQLEGWVGIHNLAKSLEPYYGEEAESIAHTVGWSAFEGGAVTTGGAPVMIDNIIKAKACKSNGMPGSMPAGGGAPPARPPIGSAAMPQKSATDKGYMGEVKIPTKPGDIGAARFTGKDLPGLPATEPKGAVPGKPTFGVGGAYPSTQKQKKVASVSKAIELLVEMVKAKAVEMCPGNPSNEPGPVSGAVHGGIAPGQTTVSGTPHGGRGPAQTSVGTTPHAGRGPAQTSIGGPAHGGRGPGQTSVSGPAYAGREGNMNKALTSMSLPRLPRAAAMDFDQWRSATRVLTAGNSAFAGDEQVQKHYGTGPLTGEVLQQVMANSDERSTRHVFHPPGPVYKACGACGRTYTIRKSAAGEELGCPTCSVVKSQECKYCGETMAKSHGGHVCCPIHGPM